jgi:hypothetical protein
VGEYGLALDTIVDIFTEESKVATQDVIASLEALAVAMALSPSQYSKRLRSSRIG